MTFLFSSFVFFFRSSHTRSDRGWAIPPSVPSLHTRIYTCIYISIYFLDCFSLFLGGNRRVDTALGVVAVVVVPSFLTGCASTRSFIDIVFIPSLGDYLGPCV